MGQHTAPTPTHTKARGSTEVRAALATVLPARYPRQVFAKLPAADTQWTARGRVGPAVVATA